MPTYDYECDACGHEFELFQGINDPLQRKCPECGKLKLRRLFGTGAAVVFKGSGFYTTDYRSDSYKKAAEKDKNGGESKSSDSGEKSSSDKSSSEKASSESKKNGGESKPPKSESSSSEPKKKPKKGKGE
jgi:putative FmdB family regulatory protein